jgi:hypothetical protein
VSAQGEVEEELHHFCHGEEEENEEEKEEEDLWAMMNEVEKKKVRKIS